MAKRQINEDGIELLKTWEGYKLKRYKDTSNLWTIGIGHLIRPGENLVQISHAECMRLFRADILDSENAVETLVTVPLNENQFSALVSFVFNIGKTQFAKSSMLRKLNAKDYKGAGDAFMQWVYDEGKKLTGLVNRRKDEKALFMRPASRNIQTIAEIGTAAALAEPTGDATGADDESLAEDANALKTLPSGIVEQKIEIEGDKVAVTSATNAADATKAGFLPTSFDELMNKTGQVTQATQGGLFRKIVAGIIGAWLAFKEWTNQNPVIVGLAIGGLVALGIAWLWMSHRADWHRRELEADKTKKDGVR